MYVLPPCIKVRVTSQVTLTFIFFTCPNICLVDFDSDATNDDSCLVNTTKNTKKWTFFTVKLTYLAELLGIFIQTIDFLKDYIRIALILYRFAKPL